jgi:hypothetical protein
VERCAFVLVPMPLLLRLLDCITLIWGLSYGAIVIFCGNRHWAGDTHTLS